MAIDIKFIAFGDTPMASEKNQYLLYETLIKNINLANPSLVINTGDKHSFKVCSNDKIDYFYKSFNPVHTRPRESLFSTGMSEKDPQGK